MLQGAQQPLQNEKKPARSYGVGFILFVSASLLALVFWGYMSADMLLNAWFYAFIREPPASDAVYIWLFALSFLLRFVLLLVALFGLERRRAGMFQANYDLFLLTCIQPLGNIVLGVENLAVFLILTVALIAGLCFTFRYIRKSKALARYFADGQPAADPPADPPPNTESE